MYGLYITMVPAHELAVQVRPIVRACLILIRNLSLSWMVVTGPGPVPLLGLQISTLDLVVPV